MSLSGIWRVCKSCFLIELSIIALPMNSIQLLNSGVTCLRVVMRPRHLCYSPAQHAVVHGSARKLFSHMLTVFLYTLVCSADFPVFWPGIFKPRQLINDFHSGCLQAILIMFVAQSNEENYWWSECKPGLAPTAWTGKSECQRAAMLSKVSWQ